jgi:hypothetical protein
MKTLAAAVLSPAILWFSLTNSVVRPLYAQHDDGLKGGAFFSDDRRSNEIMQTVLYRGPLVHDSDWMIIKGTDKNDVHRFFGGNCSMVPSNVRNDPASSLERVTFKAIYRGLGLWSMVFTDQITGQASADSGQRYRYVYINEITYLGSTKDGKAPRPSRSMPTNESPGFLQFVPSNVNAPVVEVFDIFNLQDATTGKLVAHSTFRWNERLPNSPSEQPPPFFPIVDQGYIVDLYQQRSGQLGCDGI